jgi:O-antigen ligase
VSLRWQVLSPRLGLGLLAFSALLFFKPIEDAYILPQRLGLAFGALGLMAAPEGLNLPSSPVFWLGLALFAWRAFCHLASPSAPDSLPWFAAQVPQWALFVGASALFRDGAMRRRAAAALLAAGSLAAAYALLAPLRLDPFSSGALDLGFGRRAHGSLGNPDFLGGWLAMLLPLALAAALSTQGRLRRACAAAAGLLALALALTLARAAWLAAAAGLVVAMLAGGYRPGWRGVLLWTLGPLALAGGLLAAGLGPPGTWSRLKEAADIHSDAWSSRVFMASVALDLTRERPLTGVGGGAFEMEYLRRQGERLQTERDQPFRLTADAHNDWIQTAAETGVPGLLLWAVLFALALRAAFRRAGPEGAATAGALAAFGVQGCFHFPWDITPSAGLLLMALAAAASFGPVRAWTPPRGTPLLLALALLACVVLDLRQAGASGLLNSGMSVQSDPSTRPLSEPLLKAGAQLYATDQRAWSRLGAEQMERKEYPDAVRDFQRALQILPSSPEDWTNLGLCLGLMGRLPGAEEALKQAVRLNPRSNEAWADEANAVYQQGRTDQALALARRGIAQAGGSAQAWFNLGGMLYNAGRRPEAADAFRQALRFQPDFPEAAALLAACHRAR